jgi:hypothetical protein
VGGEGKKCEAGRRKEEDEEYRYQMIWRAEERRRERGREKIESKEQFGGVPYS